MLDNATIEKAIEKIIEKWGNENRGANINGAWFSPEKVIELLQILKENK